MRRVSEVVDGHTRDIVAASNGEGNVHQEASKWFGCFTCQGLHRAKDCPNREKVSVLRQEESDSESNNDGY